MKALSTAAGPHRLLASVVAVALALLAVPPPAMPGPAPFASADEDEDGVEDALDRCPGTGHDELVDGEGCAACPCIATAAGQPWPSRAGYLECVTDRARDLRRTGEVGRRALRRALRHARRSTCGDATLTRCCEYRGFFDDVGRCRILTTQACDALDEWLFDRDGAADDEGPGSCTADVCQY